jgi:hypothetical protein
MIGLVIVLIVIIIGFFVLYFLSKSSELEDFKVENIKDLVFKNQLCKIKGNLKSTKEIKTVLSNKKCVAYFYDLESFGYAKDLASCIFLL